MKEIKFYQCEYCGERYKDAKEAYACEQSHVLPFKISKNYFNPHYKYPNLIEIEMANGEICTYYYNSIEGEDNDDW